MTSFASFVAHAQKNQDPIIMGIVNITADSFYDGGSYLGLGRAKERVHQLIEEGAELLDFGAESTRPGAPAIPAATQLARLEPIVEYARELDAWISIDTTQSAVARPLLNNGAHLINDVSCLSDPELAGCIGDENAMLMLMHSRGSMQTMTGFSEYAAEAYQDVVEEVRQEWQEALQRAELQGLARSSIIFDPGLGFHKNADQSAELLKNLGCFQDLNVPIALGASRKSFIGSLDGSPAKERLPGSLAAAILGFQAGATIFRVHDVKETRQALLALKAFSPGRPLPHV
ncbi:MAG: dihydropteroate synthase [Polyangiaceae bacterium]|nr:dihydropteroate synthase [Polyangiaceae bacterium]